MVCYSFAGKSSYETNSDFLLFEQWNFNHSKEVVMVENGLPRECSMVRQSIYSCVAVQKPDISLENRFRRRRWYTRTLNWTVPEKWSCLLFSDESRFNFAYCDGRVRVWRTAGEKYVPECLRMVTRNRIVSVMMWGPLATTVLAIGSFSMITWMRNIVRKLSWFCREHIWQQKSSIRPHGESNCRMVAAAGQIHHSMAILVPGP